MKEIIPKRMTAQLDGDFAMFLIGFRINRLLKVHQWWPVFRSMRPMVNELRANPESGFLHAEIGWGNPIIMVQYWRSPDDLVRYASDRDAAHLPAWAKFNKRIGSNGDVGIWHETYVIPAGAHESVYNNMPRFGLAQAGGHIPAEGRWANAVSRLEVNQEKSTCG